jgi:hypothetical protein
MGRSSHKKLRTLSIQAEKALRAKILGPNWMVPQTYNFDDEIIQREKVFKKPYVTTFTEIPFLFVSTAFHQISFLN